MRGLASTDLRKQVRRTEERWGRARIPLQLWHRQEGWGKLQCHLVCEEVYILAENGLRRQRFLSTVRGGRRDLVFGLHGK